MAVLDNSSFASMKADVAGVSVDIKIKIAYMSVKEKVVYVLLI